MVWNCGIIAVALLFIVFNVSSTKTPIKLGTTISA